MDSAAKRLKKWAKTNDFYVSNVVGTELRLKLNFADAVRNTASQLAPARKSAPSAKPNGPDS